MWFDFFVHVFSDVLKVLCSGGFVGLPGTVLKPILAFTFAITTPVGISLGSMLFGGGRSAGGEWFFVYEIVISSWRYSLPTLSCPWNVLYCTFTAHLKLTQGLMSAISAGMLIYAACVEMLAGDFVMDPLLWRSSIKRQSLAIVSLVLGAGCMSVIG